jgi:hypothetical protein
MCLSSILKVKGVTDKMVTLYKGRQAKNGSGLTLSPGDWVEVYADLVVSKVDKEDAFIINCSRKGSIS